MEEDSLEFGVNENSQTCLAINQHVESWRRREVRLPHDEHSWTQLCQCSADDVDCWETPKVPRLTCVWMLEARQADGAITRKVKETCPTASAEVCHSSRQPARCGQEKRLRIFWANLARLTSTGTTDRTTAARLGSSQVNIL